MNERFRRRPVGVARSPESSASRRTGRARRASWICSMAAAVLMAGGCGPRIPMPSRPPWESLPPGSPLRSRTLAEPDAWLRHYVMFDRKEEALAAFAGPSPLVPGDRLLRALQHALILHEAGEFGRSNEVLEWAEVEAEARYTRSLSREVASILVSDRVLAYTPPAGELAMIPYYRMLNYLAADDLPGAMVEARKATSLLDRLARESGDRCYEDGLIQYLAGLVQLSAAEHADAAVSLRQAHRSFRSCPDSATAMATALAPDLYRAAHEAGLHEVADSVAERYSLEPRSVGPSAEGDLLVLVEHGFVAHRAQEAIHIPLPDDDLEKLRGEDEEGLTRLAARISSDYMLGAEGRSSWQRSEYRGSAWSDALDGAYILRLAWPTYRLEANRPRAVRVGVEGAFTPTTDAGNVSIVMRQELTRERPEMLLRLILRGLTKHALTREIEEETEKKHGDAAGFLLGRIANLAGNSLERADTRSWSLLPDRISLLRVRLPEGVHDVSLQVLDETGDSRLIPLGAVRVSSGELTVLRERVWSGDAEARWREEFDAPEARLADQNADGSNAIAADTVIASGS